MLWCIVSILRLIDNTSLTQVSTGPQEYLLVCSEYTTPSSLVKMAYDESIRSDSV